MSTTIINDFKDLRKIIGEVTKKNPAKSRYQQQVEKMGYPLPLVEDRGMNPAEIERLRKAYVGIKTMDPTKPPGKKLLAFMRKLSKNQLQDIAGAGINFLSLLAVSNLIRMGIKPENIKYTKSEANENDFLKNLKKTNPKEYKNLMKFKGKSRPMKEDAMDSRRNVYKKNQKQIERLRKMLASLKDTGKQPDMQKKLQVWRMLCPGFPGQNRLISRYAAHAPPGPDRPWRGGGICGA